MIREVDRARVDAMLIALEDDGWRPTLYAERDPCGRAWVCFPQGEVRTFAVKRATTPWAAVEALYTHAVQYPNDPFPKFIPSDVARERWAGPVAPPAWVRS